MKPALLEVHRALHCLAQRHEDASGFTAALARHFGAENIDASPRDQDIARAALHRLVDRAPIEALIAALDALGVSTTAGDLRELYESTVRDRKAERAAFVKVPEATVPESAPPSATPAEPSDGPVVRVATLDDLVPPAEAPAAAPADPAEPGERSPLNCAAAAA